jgi:alkanesulfonate monooxygenase SsuD/methylene tetrahydromethanopterin reductase-like flavin-dependent oxidoreductase (luciferase family)
VTKYGLLLPSREALLWGGSDAEVVIGAARHAQEAGYHSAWVGDSLLARPRFEPLTILAALATATPRLELGTAVLLPLLRHPLTLAHTAATLDRLAPGRLILGVGAGGDVPGTHAELAAVGVRSTRRVGDMLEEVDRCRRLWRGEAEGVALLPRPASPGGPRVWLGGNGPRMLRLAGRLFDGWMPFTPTPGDYATAHAVVAAEAERAGRDPGALETAAYLTITVDDRPATAVEQLDRYMLGYYGVPGAVMAGIQACHTGTVESAAEWVAAYAAAGARHLILRMGTPELHAHRDVAAALIAALRVTR